MDTCASCDEPRADHCNHCEDCPEEHCEDCGGCVELGMCTDGCDDEDKS